MAGERFDVAFSGQISEGANPDEVKVRVGKMFKAGEEQLARLFSGQSIVIKANVDEATAKKYRQALLNVGAVCEINAKTAAAPSPPPPAPAPESGPAATSGAAPEAAPGPVAPPQTDPLGITAKQIGELGATLAPPGSDIADNSGPVQAPQYDLSAFEMAPVGSTLSDDK